MRVKDVMSQAVVSVRPEAPLKEVAQLLLDHAISGAPVVDDDARVLGVISESDFVIKERGRLTTRHSPLRWLTGASDRSRAKVIATTAAEAMTSPPITVEGSMSLHEAAALMAERSINRLPVTDSGRLIGIITRADIMRVFTISDDALESRVRSVLGAVDGLTIDAVRGGTVVLSGVLPTEEVVRSVSQVAEAIDGVIAVDGSQLRWRSESGSVVGPGADHRLGEFYLGTSRQPDQGPEDPPPYHQEPRGDGSDS